MNEGVAERPMEAAGLEQPPHSIQNIYTRQLAPIIKTHTHPPLSHTNSLSQNGEKAKKNKKNKKTRVCYGTPVWPVCNFKHGSNGLKLAGEFTREGKSCLSVLEASQALPALRPSRAVLRRPV